MKNLYLIVNNFKQDYIIAESIPDAIEIWKEFYKTNDEPSNITFVSNYVISRLK